MSFPDDIVEEVWKNANGHCECTVKTHARLDYSLHRWVIEVLFVG